MNREELLAKGFSEEQVTEILNTFHSKNNEMKKELESYKTQEENWKKIGEQNAQLQKQLDEINEANLTEQEKIAKEREEADRYLSNAKRINNTAKAKDILAGLDIDEDLISTLVSEDEQKTINNATLLKNKLESVKNVAITTTKEQLANLDLKPTPSNVPQDNGAMTLEKFNAMSLTEQVKFKRENPEIYNEFNN